jgi:hypothetical protein
VILFNALRLNVTNVWTVAEWSDQEQVDELPNQPPPNLPFKAFLPVRTSNRLFVAISPDEVYDVELDRVTPLGKDFLQRNVEVWRLLRNGCLAGTVDADEQRFDLINLAAFGGVLVEFTLNPRDVLASTWDFKWPAGRTLRVRFAKPDEPRPDRPERNNYSPDVLENVRQEVERLVRAWVYDGNTKLVNLELEGFTWFEEGEEYEILIDLNDLPLDIPGSKNREPRKVRLPFSEIGSYSGRVDYRRPTIYLGFPEGIKDESKVLIDRTSGRQGEGLDGYFGSDAFKHIVLHEFGHALGLPHLHQSPDLLDPFVDELTAQAVIRAKLGLDLKIDEIREELKVRWSGPGAGSGTDWFDVIGGYAASVGRRSKDVQSDLKAEREKSGGEGIGKTERELVAYLATNSVMMGLPVRSVYQGQDLGVVDYLPALGPIDRDWIKQLYPLPATEAAP